MGTTVAFGVSCQAGLYCGSQAHIWVGLLVSPLPWQLPQHFSVLRYLVLGEESLVNSSLNLLSPMSEVHDVFRNRKMLSTSEVGDGQLWSTAIAHIVWGVSRGSLNNNWIVGFSSQLVYGSLWGALFAHVMESITFSHFSIAVQNYMCFSETIVFEETSNNFVTKTSGIKFYRNSFICHFVVVFAISATAKKLNTTTLEFVSHMKHYTWHFLPIIYALGRTEHT